MSPTRFDEITARFATLRIGVVGDFSLDRYLDIDPTKTETSIETGLPVHLADDPMSAFAEGTGRVLQEIEFLKRVATNAKY